MTITRQHTATTARANWQAFLPAALCAVVSPVYRRGGAIGSCVPKMRPLHSVTVINT